MQLVSAWQADMKAGDGTRALALPVVPVAEARRQAVALRHVDAAVVVAERVVLVPLAVGIRHAARLRGVLSDAATAAPQGQLVVQAHLIEGARRVGQHRAVRLAAASLSVPHAVRVSQAGALH